MKRLLFLIGVGILAQGCGDDGKPKLYESCGSDVICSGELVCFQGTCTTSCTVKDTSAVVGDCLVDSECDAVIVGCCKIVLVSEGTAKGNCSATPTL